MRSPDYRNKMWALQKHVDILQRCTQFTFVGNLQKLEMTHWRLPQTGVWQAESVFPSKQILSCTLQALCSQWSGSVWPVLLSNYMTFDVSSGYINTP